MFSGGVIAKTFQCDERVEPALEARLGDPRHRLRRLAAGVERDERLARLAVADELEAPEEPEPAHLADRRVPLGERRRARSREVLALRRRVLDDALLPEDLDRRDARGAGERVAASR